MMSLLAAMHKYSSDNLNIVCLVGDFPMVFNFKVTIKLNLNGKSIYMCS